MASHPAVHPVALPPPYQAVGPPAPPAVRINDFPGSPGTLMGLALRFAQLGFALTALCIMVSIVGFSSVTAFCFLVAAMVLQCIWSLCLGVLDCYALLTKRSLRNSLILSFFVVGDWITSTMTFAGACAAAGITVLIDNDLNQCGPNHCNRFEAAAAMAFMSWVITTISFFLSFWILVTCR